jgi:hypothetical protein
MTPTRYRDNLWVLIAGPTIWAVHFVASYAIASIYCARVGRSAPLDPVTNPILVLAGIALAGIVAIGIWGYRRHRKGERPDIPHTADTDLDRHRFVGFAVLLLCGLSGIAVVYTALVALVFENCR